MLWSIIYSNQSSPLLALTLGNNHHHPPDDTPSGSRRFERHRSVSKPHEREPKSAAARHISWISNRLFVSVYVGKCLAENRKDQLHLGDKTLQTKKPWDQTWQTKKWDLVDDTVTCRGWTPAINAAGSAVLWQLGGEPNHRPRCGDGDEPQMLLRTNR